MRSKIYLPKAFILGPVLGMALLFPEIAEAQCAMCRAVLESEGNTGVAEGVNNGIVYLMAIPYILIGALFFFIYRKVKS
jgi:hypothetical protein